MVTPMVLKVSDAAADLLQVAHESEGDITSSFDALNVESQIINA